MVPSIVYTKKNDVRAVAGTVPFQKVHICINSVHFRTYWYLKNKSVLLEIFRHFYVPFMLPNMKL